MANSKIKFTKRFFLIFTILFVCVGCDQSTKALARSYLSENQVWSFWGDFFRLQLAYNKGAFLSLGSALPDAWRAGLFSAGVAVLLLLLLGYILSAKTLSKREFTALNLLLAGGVANLIDRVNLGYVIDFINMGIGTLRTGVFNVADVAVSAGAALLFAEIMFSSAKQET